jgi:hypothetical protein
MGVIQVAIIYSFENITINNYNNTIIIATAAAAECVICVTVTTPRSLRSTKYFDRPVII